MMVFSENAKSLIGTLAKVIEFDLAARADRPVQRQAGQQPVSQTS
jgi:hypothetical protein